jgi:hypothetical protein
MARQANNKPRFGEVQKFELSESQVIKENERLLSQGQAPAEQPKDEVDTKDQAPTEQPQDKADTKEQTPLVQPQSVADAHEQASTEQPQDEADAHEQASTEQPQDEAGTKGQAPAKGDSGRKIGINAFVPMDYYEKLVLLKMRTGVPIKEIALRAVKEYIDRNY